MRILIITITAMLSLYYLNCHNNTSDSDESTLGNMLFPDVKNGLSLNDIVLSNGTSPGDYRIDPYNLESVSIDGDSIYFTVSYSGGCKRHDFSLVAYNYFMESHPVQVSILLAHNSNEDACEALITKSDLSFNLLPLKNEYIKSYGSSSDKIILRVLVSGSIVTKEYQL